MNKELDPYPWWNPQEEGCSAQPDFMSEWAPGEEYEQDIDKYPPFDDRPPF